MGSRLEDNGKSQKCLLKLAYKLLPRFSSKLVCSGGLHEKHHLTRTNDMRGSEETIVPVRIRPRSVGLGLTCKIFPCDVKES